jgi:hypothetical protein
MCTKLSYKSFAVFIAILLLHEVCILDVIEVINAIVKIPNCHHGKKKIKLIFNSRCEVCSNEPKKKELELSDFVYHIRGILPQMFVVAL